MSRVRMRRQIRSWGRRQMYSLFSSLGTLLGHRLSTIMTVTVIGVGMAMPLGLYVSVSNLNAVDLHSGALGSVSVFLEFGLDGQAAEDLAGRVEASQLGSVTKLISPDEGLSRFQEQSGFGTTLEAFEENPLPWVLQLTPVTSEDNSDRQAAEVLADWLEQQPGVDLVQVDTKWLQRLESLLNLGNAVVAVLALLFSLAVVVIVANTIRLDVAARFEEIQVLSLVGASDSFIRQPFLYSGFWYGILGSLVSLLLLGLSLLYLQKPLNHLLDAYSSQFEIDGLGFSQTMLVMLGGGLLGLLGAWMAVQRYLGQIRRGRLAAL